MKYSSQNYNMVKDCNQKDFLIISQISLKIVVSEAADFPPHAF